MVLQISNIWIGHEYKSQCQIETGIPSWLIVHSIGIIILILNLLMLLRWQFRRNIFIAIFLSLLLVIWLVKGSLWTYSVFNRVEFTEPIYNTNFCNIFLYYFSFGNLTMIWIFLAVISVYFIYTKIFMKSPNVIAAVNTINV